MSDLPTDRSQLTALLSSNEQRLDELRRQMKPGLVIRGRSSLRASPISPPPLIASAFSPVLSTSMHQSMLLDASQRQNLSPPAMSCSFDLAASDDDEEAIGAPTARMSPTELSKLTFVRTSNASPPAASATSEKPDVDLYQAALDRSQRHVVRSQQAGRDTDAAAAAVYTTDKSTAILRAKHIRILDEAFSAIVSADIDPNIGQLDLNGLGNALRRLHVFMPQSMPVRVTSPLSPKSRTPRAFSPASPSKQMSATDDDLVSPIEKLKADESELQRRCFNLMLRMQSDGFASPSKFHSPVTRSKELISRQTFRALLMLVLDGAALLRHAKALRGTTPLPQTPNVTSTPAGTRASNSTNSSKSLDEDVLAVARALTRHAASVRLRMPQHVRSASTPLSARPSTIRDSVKLKYHQSVELLTPSPPGTSSRNIPLPNMIDPELPIDLSHNFAACTFKPSTCNRTMTIDSSASERRRIQYLADQTLSAVLPTFPTSPIRSRPTVRAASAEPTRRNWRSTSPLSEAATATSPPRHDVLHAMHQRVLAKHALMKRAWDMRREAAEGCSFTPNTNKRANSAPRHREPDYDPNGVFHRLYSRSIETVSAAAKAQLLQHVLCAGDKRHNQSLASDLLRGGAVDTTSVRIALTQPVRPVELTPAQVLCHEIDALHVVTRANQPKPKQDEKDEQKKFSVMTKALEVINPPPPPNPLLNQPIKIARGSNAATSSAPVSAPVIAAAPVVPATNAFVESLKAAPIAQKLSLATALADIGKQIDGPSKTVDGVPEGVARAAAAALTATMKASRASVRLVEELAECTHRPDLSHSRQRAAAIASSNQVDPALQEAIKRAAERQRCATARRHEARSMLEQAQMRWCAQWEKRQAAIRAGLAVVPTVSESVSKLSQPKHVRKVFVPEPKVPKPAPVRVKKQPKVETTSESQHVTELNSQLDVAATDNEVQPAEPVFQTDQINQTGDSVTDVVLKTADDVQSTKFEGQTECVTEVSEGQVDAEPGSHIVLVELPQLAAQSVNVDSVDSIESVVDEAESARYVLSVAEAPEVPAALDLAATSTIASSLSDVTPSNKLAAVRLFKSTPRPRSAWK